MKLEKIVYNQYGGTVYYVCDGKHGSMLFQKPETEQDAIAKIKAQCDSVPAKKQEVKPEPTPEVKPAPQAEVKPEVKPEPPKPSEQPKAQPVAPEQPANDAADARRRNRAQLFTGENAK